jgi:hypothetical protein
MSDTGGPLASDKLRGELVALIDRYAKATGAADSTVCRQVFGNGDKSFIPRLRRNKNFTIFKAQRFERTLRKMLAELPRKK